MSEKSIVLPFSPYKSIRDQIWPCRKICQGQPRVLIWTNLVVLEHPTLHTKCQGHRPFGSGEDFLRLYHLWAWRPSWSSDLDRLNIMFFFSSTHGGSTWNLASVGSVASEEMFNNVDDGRRRPAYPLSSPISLRLKWAKKKKKKKNSTEGCVRPAGEYVLGTGQGQEYFVSVSVQVLKSMYTKSVGSRHNIQKLSDQPGYLQSL